MLVRALRSGQVNADQCPGAGRPTRDRRREARLAKGDTPPARQSRCPFPKAAGSSTPRECARSGLPTSARTICSGRSPTSRTEPRSVRRAASMHPPRTDAPSTPGSQPGTRVLSVSRLSAGCWPAGRPAADERAMPATHQRPPARRRLRRVSPTTRRVCPTAWADLRGVPGVRHPDESAAVDRVEVDARYHSNPDVTQQLRDPRLRILGISRYVRVQVERTVGRRDLVYSDAGEPGEKQVTVLAVARTLSSSSRYASNAPTAACCARVGGQSAKLPASRSTESASSGA